jgi:hypothetical protein
MSDAVYRKVFVRIWRHTGFAKLSAGAKVLALYALTGPQTNRLGCFVFSPALAAEDLRVTPEQVVARLTEACKVFEWEWDQDTRVLLIPSWWAWNPPPNPKAAQGALKDRFAVPSGPLLDRCLQTLSRYGIAGVSDTVSDRCSITRAGTGTGTGTGTTHTPRARSSFRGQRLTVSPKMFDTLVQPLLPAADTVDWFEVFSQLDAKLVADGEQVLNPLAWLRARMVEHLESTGALKASQSSLRAVPSERERQEMREFRRKALGRCPHDPKCRTEAECVDALIAERRASA